MTFIVTGGETYSKYLFVLIGAYVFTPALVAIYFAKKEKIKLPIFNTKYIKLLYAFLLALAVVVLTAFFDLPFCKLRSPESFTKLMPTFIQNFSLVNQYILFLLLWITLGIVVSSIQFLGFLGLELMFSGYAWEKLKYLGFWKASWLIALYMGLWTSPLILVGIGYPGSPALGIPCSFIYCFLIVPIKIYLRIQSKVILTSALFFMLLTHFSNSFVYFFEMKNYLLSGVQGLTGFIALLFINLIIFLKTRKTPLLEYEL